MKNQVAMPDLNTIVTLYGNECYDEVSGPPCIAVIIGIIVSQ